MPASLVLTSRARLVSLFVRVTVAPGMTPPVGSVTVPVTVPLLLCASAATLPRSSTIPSTATTPIARLVVRVIFTLFVVVSSAETRVGPGRNSRIFDPERMSWPPHQAHYQLGVDCSIAQHCDSVKQKITHCRFGFSAVAWAASWEGPGGGSLIISN